ncbi:OLC1v1038909C5 [Oldenlandia corymbosa var. corymbosa]|nr:OLC1v1038909C5 [Oldenlandia corymbosa var. corymbosa]
MASRKDGIASDATSPLPLLGDAASGLKGDTDKKSDAEQGVYHPPASCYNYYIPGYNGTYSQLDDQGYLTMGGGSYGAVPTDLYYFPGYPYNTGYMGADGENPYCSSGYLQQPVSYGSDALQSQSWDSTYAGDVNNRAVNKTEDVKSAFSRNGVNSSTINSSKTMNSSTVPLNSKARKFTVSSDFSKSYSQAKPLKPLNKLGSGFQSMDSFNGFYPAGKFSGYGNPQRGVYNYMHYSPMHYQTPGRMWNSNQRFKPKTSFRRDGENEGLNELSRGPRTSGKSDPSKEYTEDEQLGLAARRDKYNLEDFQTEYGNAKFFVIKSYSEDDIHKCVKYDVWSSTPNGNKKLDAAFREAEAKASETGTKCPIFLFFSVNASGQFVGVAEMIGQVDFNKNMDFWQLDKWNGFFPLKWHIVKDLPNNLLKHIILENNENRPVTFSRDTQEVGLKQGIEMLNIFKSYSAKTTLLDDFLFYENREKTLKAKRISKPTLQNGVVKADDISVDVNGGERVNEEALKINGSADLMPSLVSLTKDLTISA